MSRPLLALAAAVGITLATHPARAGDGPDPGHWPQFRGPGGRAVAPDGMKLPVTFGPDDHVLWKTPLPAGHSSPCIWGDRIFLTGFDKAAGKLETLCLDRKDGRILWRQAAPAQKIERVHQISNPATSTPATDGERVYVYFGSFGLLCYDFDGREVWRLPRPTPGTRFGTGTSPVVAGDLVLLNCEYPPRACLHAVNRRTGAVEWKKERLALLEGYATPVLWSHDGLDDVVVLSPMRLTAYAPKDGAERWSVAVNSTACTTPVAGDGRLYAAIWTMGGEPADRVKLPSFDELLAKYDTNKDGKISKDELPADLSVMKRSEAGDIPGADVKLKPLFDMVDLNKNGQIERFEWGLGVAMAARPVENGLLAIKPGGDGDVTRTHVAWKDTKAVPEVPSPLYYRGRVYMVRDGGIVSCLDAATGKLVYRERLGPGGAYFASPIAGDGKVYAASGRGVVVVIAAGDKFEILARNDFKEAILASPAVADGKLYIRTEGHLYAFAP